MISLRKVSVRNCTCSVLAGMALTLFFAMLVSSTGAEDNANFYLKASKSVPRIGRRDFFLKTQTPSNVPLMGRRRTIAPLTESRDWGVNSGWPWYRNSDSLPGPSKRENDNFYNRRDVRPLRWSNIEKVLEEHPDIWYSDDMARLFEDDDAGEWTRMRRAADNKEIEEGGGRNEV